MSSGLLSSLPPQSTEDKAFSWSQAQGGPFDSMEFQA